MAGTLATIRTYAALRADQDVGNYPTTAQDLILINQAGQDVWNRLIEAGWPLDFSSVTITSTAGSQALGIGSILGVHGVYYQTGGQFYRVRRLNEGKRAAMMDPSGSPGSASAYDIRISPTLGPMIELLPPSPGGQYRVDYIPEWPGFSVDADIWYGPSGSDQLVGLRAGAMMLRKEGSVQDATILDKEFDELMPIIMMRASRYFLRDPAMIRDENQAESRFTFDYSVIGTSGGLGF